MDNNNVLQDTHKDFKSNVENSWEYETVVAFKNIINQNEIPKDFNTWTVKKQYNWINNNISKLFPNVPGSLLNIIPAFYIPLNYDRPLEKLPEWMDMDKYRRGQKFVNDHYATAVITILLSVFYIYLFQDGLLPIIMAGNSHTPYLAFKRYLSTLNRMISWQIGEPWIKETQAYEDMQVARTMHSIIRKKMCQVNNKQIKTATTFANPWCPDREILLKDFASLCPYEKIKQRPYTLWYNSPYRPKTMNNGDMTLGQGGFVLLYLLNPQKIGVHDATDEDLEAYCHMWRCYGYFLGLDDKYNFFRDSLEEVKQRARDYYQYWVLPNFKDCTPEWEHITRCLVESFNYYPIIQMPYKAILLITTDALDIKMPHLYASLNYTEWIIYKVCRFVADYVLRFSITRAYFNKVVRRIIQKANEFSPEKLAEIHEKSKKLVPDFSITY